MILYGNFIKFADTQNLHSNIRNINHMATAPDTAREHSLAGKRLAPRSSHPWAAQR